MAVDLSAAKLLASQINAGLPVERDLLAQAARAITGELAARHPGHTIEIRVPPFAAVQVCATGGEGPQHRRGTPPNLVEMDAQTAVRLAVAAITWDDAVATGLVRYSGAHAGDVATMLPL